MRLIIMGAAGAGKGTIAAKIKEEFNIAHISTGNMFRVEIAEATELGVLAKSYIDQGKLVPDEVTIAMVMKRLSEDDCTKGFLLDGFPRTIAQAEALEKALVAENKDIQMVINLDVTLECLKQRIVGRRICTNCDAIYNTFFTPSKVEGVCDVCGNTLSQRSDDTEERLLVRWDEYLKNTEPVLGFYRERGIAVDIDATAKPEKVWEDIQPFLKGLV